MKKLVIALIVPLVLCLSGFIYFSSKNLEIHDYTGLTVSQARKKADMDGVPFRLVKRNGKALTITEDFREDRVNANAILGVVVSYVQGY